MATTIPGTNIDLHELRFDKDGRVLSDVTLPRATKQVFVFSHGWNNDANEARNLYGAFFRNFEKIGRRDSTSPKLSRLPSSEYSGRRKSSARVWPFSAVADPSGAASVEQTS